jgi:hypothetical protein
MSFVAQHIQRTQTIHLAGPPSRVFPLFEPLPEREWAEGWEPTMLFPPSGEAEVGAVFTSHHSGEPETIWAISVYDKASFHITYVRVTADSRVAFVDIRCAGREDGTTSATVSYTFTALSEAGNAFIERYTQEHYQYMMMQWEQAINHYLQHGKRLQHH